MEDGPKVVIDLIALWTERVIESVLVKESGHLSRRMREERQDSVRIGLKVARQRGGDEPERCSDFGCRTVSGTLDQDSTGPVGRR